MQKKYFFGLGFLASVLVAGLFLFKTSGAPVPKPEVPTCCKKVSDKCTPAIPVEEAGPSTPLESLSHQFISFPVLVY